jgi:aarF domain-containing kinase
MPRPPRRVQGNILLDLLRLASASRTVARQHVKLRTAQLHRYRRSSGAAQEIESQIQEVANGVRAAIALAQRFLEEDARDVWKTGQSAWTGKEGEKNNEDTQRRDDVRPEPQHDNSFEAINASAKQDMDLEPPPGIDINVFRTKKGARLTSHENSDVQPSSTQDEGSPVLPELSNSTIATGSQFQSQSIDSKDHLVAEEVAKLTGLDQTNTNPSISQMRESRVPSSRFGRLWQYGGLATSMAFGAMGETLRRATGSSTGGSLVLGPKNMERLVAKLSRMRGAALKLGQMISFQGQNYYLAFLSLI